MAYREHWVRPDEHLVQLLRLMGVKVKTLHTVGEHTGVELALREFTLPRGRRFVAQVYDHGSSEPGDHCVSIELVEIAPRKRKRCRR